MENVYDMAHALARALKNSDEYREYHESRDRAMEDETNKALLEEYKRLQFRLQGSMASGKAPDEEEMQRLKQIGTLLQFNEDASRYILAEFRYQKLMSDMFKILAETADIDLDALLGSH